MNYRVVAVAGTFDHLHQGHEKLLQTAKKSGQKLVVGLCQESMLKNKPYSQSIESYETRRLALAKFKPDQIIPLNDIYGPALTSTKIDAIVCSPLTRPNVEDINRLRKSNDLKPLAIIEVALVKGSDGEILSSTRIRQGLVNRKGFYYPQLFNRDLTLPDNLRSQLQKPFDRLVPKIGRSKFGIVAVGDIAALSFVEQNIPLKLAVVDLHSQRQKAFSKLTELGLQPGLTAKNPAGMITKNLAEQLFKALNEKQPTLLVEGEEDLAVLPTILFVPLNTVVFYGQHNEGLVKIKVNEAAKTKARHFIERFI